MNVPPLKPEKPQPTFGILKGYKKTPYGEYTWGEFKGHKIEIYDAYKYNQKLQYVSNSQTSNWVQSKLKYIQDGIKKIMRSKAK
jgi:hypothetical protein